MCRPHRSAGENSVCLANTGLPAAESHLSQPRPCYGGGRGKRHLLCTGFASGSPTAAGNRKAAWHVRASKNLWGAAGGISGPNPAPLGLWLQGPPHAPRVFWGRMLNLPNNFKGESSWTHSRYQKACGLPGCRLAAFLRGHLRCWEHQPSMPQSHARVVAVPCPHPQENTLRLPSTQQHGDERMAPAPAAGSRERGTTEEVAPQDLIRGGKQSSHSCLCACRRRLLQASCQRQPLSPQSRIHEEQGVLVQRGPHWCDGGGDIA